MLQHPNSHPPNLTFQTKNNNILNNKYILRTFNK